MDERPELKHRSLNGYPVIGTPMDLEKVIADYAMHGVYIDNVVIAAQPDELSLAAWTEVARVCQTLKIGLEILPERLIAKEIPSNVVPESSSDPSVPVFARLADHWLDRAQFQRLAKNIACRQPTAPLLFAIVSQHVATQKIAMSCRAQ